MGHGGKRPGAGKPKGSKNKATLEKQAVLDAFNQRVMAKADELFNAQFSLAAGSTACFRIEETGEGKSKKREHVLVTDSHEIKAFLDEHEGDAGVVEGVFYYLTTHSPDNRAIDSLMNRAFGKPTEKVAIVNLTTPEADALILGAAKEHGLPVPGETFGGEPIIEQ